MLWSLIAPSQYWVLRKHFRVSQSSGSSFLIYRQHIGVWIHHFTESQRGSALIQGAEENTTSTQPLVHCTQLRSLLIYIWWCNKFYGSQENIFWTFSQIWVPSGTASFSTEQKARHKSEMLMEKRVNCLERIHGYFKPVEVTNSIFRYNHFNSMYFGKYPQTTGNEHQVLSGGITNSC